MNDAKNGSASCSMRSDLTPKEARDHWINGNGDPANVDMDLYMKVPGSVCGIDDFAKGIANGMQTARPGETVNFDTGRSAENAKVTARKGLH